MGFTVFTYGYLDAVWNILNAISMVLKNNIILNILELIFLISLGISSVNILSEGGQNIVSRIVSRSIVGVIVFSVFLMPSSSLQIIDKISKRIDHVDNLPIGFVVPVAILETTGEIVTNIFEQAFRTADNFDFSDYGMLFGANAVQSFRTMKIQSPTLSENFYNFTRRCIVPAIVVSEWFSVDELYNEKDVWALLEKHYPTTIKGIRRFDIVDDGKKSTVRCAEGMSILERQFMQDRKIIEKKFTNTIFNIADSIQHYTQGRTQVVTETMSFNKNFFQVLNNVLQIKGQHASDSMRQIMFMNAAANLDNSYDLAQAMMRTESGWSIASNLATQYLPMMMVVLKCLVYVSFIFVLPMILISGDFGFYHRYLILVFSFQLWPSLFVILNYIVDMYSVNQLSGIANESITYANFGQLTEFSDKISVLAGGMMFFIPVVAFQLASGGIGALASFASSVVSGAQMNISGVATEAATGNRSLDNVSMNNTSMNNTSSNKHDVNSVFAGGKDSMQQTDGSVLVTKGDGTSFAHTGAGITKGQYGYRIDTQNAMQGQIASALNESSSIVESTQAQFANSQSALQHNALDLVKAMSKNSNLTESLSQHLSADEAQSVTKTVEDYKKKGIATGVTANVGGGFNIPHIFNISSSASASAEFSQGRSQQNQSQEQVNILNKIAQNKDASEALGISEDTRKSFSQSYNDTQEARQQHQIAQDNHTSLQNSLHRTDTTGVNVSRDMTQEGTEYVAQQLGVSNLQAQQLLELGDQKAWQKADIFVAQVGKNQLQELGIALPNKEQFKSVSNQNYEQVSSDYQQTVNSENSKFAKEMTNFDANRAQQEKDLRVSKKNLNEDIETKKASNQKQIVEQKAKH